MQQQEQVLKRQIRVRRHRLNSNWTLALLLVPPFLFASSGFLSPAQADTISPNITSGGKVYSEERPNKEFFGTGMSGRLSEASHLRFSGEQALDDGDLPVALKRLSKAVQLDPGDPTGHFIYARAMTAKINRDLRKGQNLDPELLSDCIEEWKLIARHDADTSEQMEAKVQARRLARIGKLMNPQQKQGVLARFKVKEKQKLALKERPRLADKDGLDSDDMAIKESDFSSGRKIDDKPDRGFSDETGEQADQ